VAVPLLIVDGANVVGSVPDGWWRDRLGAARRLLAALADVPSQGMPAAAGLRGPVEVILVVEGAARPLADEAPPPDVRVLAAPTSGDDTIVELVTAALAGGARRCVVVTADRGLRDRVRALGGEVVGPRSLPYP
jgi:hypothetical protein